MYWIAVKGKKKKMKKTKQGVRDLSYIAPKRSRGYKPSKEAMQFAGLVEDMSPPSYQEMLEELAIENTI